MIPGMKSLSSEEQLRTLSLYLLEFRRMRGNLIETYRILRGLDRVDVERMFPLVGKTRTRGHNRTIPKVKILNWGQANFNGIRQELSKVNWGSLWEGKGTSGK